MDFEKIDKARRVLGLGNTATMKEIKEAYRKLALQHHPDRCSIDRAECEARLKEINRAKDTLLQYCSSYRYSFKKPDVEKTLISEETYQNLKQFYDGWWADLDL